MVKRICYIYIESDGNHLTTNFCNKKTLYKYKKLTKLEYQIGYINNDNFHISIDKSIEINDENLFDCLNDYNINIKNVDIIIGYDLIHLFNTLNREYIYNNIKSNILNTLNIDVKSFNNICKNELSINDIYYSINNENTSNLNKIKCIFNHHYNNL